MKKRLALPITVLLIFLLFCFPCNAENEEKQIEDALPEEYKALFYKNGDFSLPDLPFFFDFLFENLRDELKSRSVDLSAFLALVLLCSIFTILEDCLRRRQSKGALKLCVLLSGCMCIVAALMKLFALTGEHLRRLCGFLSVMIPVITGVSVSMGSVGTAAVSGTALTMILALIGEFTSGILLPLLQVNSVLDLSSCLTENKGLSALAGAMRSFFLSLLAILSTLLLTVFAFQHTVAAKGDSLALRAFKFTAGSLVPLVGSAFSESTKTLLSGFDLIRTTAGAVGIAVILLMLLPPFVMLLLANFSFRIARSFSTALDNSLLSSVFSCGSSASGGLCALVAICDLSLVVAFGVCMLFSF